MTLEIIVAAIGSAFIVLVIFLIMTLHRLRKVMKKTERVLVQVHHLLHALSEPSVDLVHNTNNLVIDIKRKSEGLDVLLRPFYGLKKESFSGHKGFEKICDLLECVVEGAKLFSKIKNERKS